jgi:hypothetical protein
LEQAILEFKLALKVVYFDRCIPSLECNSHCTQGNWVTAPKHLFLMHGGREFQVRIDPSQLAASQCHYAEIQAFEIDSDGNECGDPVFRVPITVIKPQIIAALPGPGSGSGSGAEEQALFEQQQQHDGEIVPNSAAILSFSNVPFKSGHRKRIFVQPPAGTTWIDVIVTPSKLPGKGIFVLHTTQLLANSSYAVGNFEQYLQLEYENRSLVKSIAINDSNTLEVRRRSWMCDSMQRWCSFAHSAASMFGIADLRCAILVHLG